jgi:hypothetical protein
MNFAAEFRLHRDTPFKEINHPFFYIPVKEKELSIIGTRKYVVVVVVVVVVVI